MISVIIPTYNREKTIKRAVLSVLNQTYKDIEIIVVDDNSKDNTYDVIQQIKDDRIRYYKLEKNFGACYARNYGIQKSKGEYIAFQDSDDEWKNEKLEKQLDTLKKQNVDIVFCSFDLYEEDKLLKKIPKNMKSGCINYDTLLEKSIISTQTILGKKECFTKEKFNDQMPRFQDWELVLRLSKKYKVYYEDETLVNLYAQKDSISKNNTKAILALDKIFNINKKEILKNKRALSNIYIYYASFLDKDKRISYIMKGLKAKFDLISIAKAIRVFTKK